MVSYSCMVTLLLAVAGDEFVARLSPSFVAFFKAAQKESELRRLPSADSQVIRMARRYRDEKEQEFLDAVKSNWKSLGTTPEAERSLQLFKNAEVAEQDFFQGRKTVQEALAAWLAIADRFGPSETANEAIFRAAKLLERAPGSDAGYVKRLYERIVTNSPELSKWSIMANAEIASIPVDAGDRFAARQAFIRNLTLAVENVRELQAQLLKVRHGESEQQFFLRVRDTVLALLATSSILKTNVAYDATIARSKTAIDEVKRDYKDDPKVIGIIEESIQRSSRRQPVTKNTESSDWGRRILIPVNIGVLVVIAIVMYLRHRKQRIHPGL